MKFGILIRTPTTMSSSNDDMVSYQNLRRNLPEQPMMPSAPVYDTVTRIDNLPKNQNVSRREEMIPLCSSPSLDAKKRLRIEAEIKKTKEQLMKERQIMEEEFKAKETLLNAELELVLTNLEYTNEEPSVHFGEHKSSGELQLGNKTVNSFSAQDQVLETQKPVLNGHGSIERPVELPKRLGLEQLSVLDYISIRQLRSSAVDESYEVVVPGDIAVLWAIMSFEVANVAQMGLRRVIKVYIFDKEMNELVRVSADGTNLLEVFVNGQLASLIRRMPTYFKPMLMLHDSQGRPALKIKGPSSKSNRNIFSVQTIEKVNIGSVNKSPAAVPAGYESGNHADIKFPLDLDDSFKAAIIASSFIIDFLFRRRPGILCCMR